VEEREDVVKRIIVLAISVILALVVAAPLASAQTASTNQTNLGALTASWWDWAMTDPSPLEGSYTDGTQCDGNFVDGVFFLAGSTTTSPVERTCTVPADTPILFPVLNVVCSKAFKDPTPYTRCATNIVDQALVGSSTYARLDGDSLSIQRIASGPFQWTIPTNNNPFGLQAGTYPAASDGLWVYLPQGLPAGEYTLEFGGKYPNVGFRQKITYNLTVV
jgi:hypothetical protein